MLTKEEVLHIAKLCKLNLSEEEITSLAQKLSDTVDFIKVLEEVDTTGIEETYQVTGITNVVQQPDEAPTTLTQEESLENASEDINKLFSTKAVFKR